MSVALILGGCSYNSKLEPNLSMNSTTMVKLPYTLVIDNSKLLTSKVIARPGFSNLTVDNGDALTESVKRQLTNSFKSVHIFMTNDDISKFDYLLELESKTLSICGAGSCSLTANITTQFYDTKQKNKLLIADDFVDMYTWELPGGAAAMNFLTGISVYILAPIFQPIGTHLSGVELSKQVSQSNDRVSLKIAKKVIFADVYN